MTATLLRTGAPGRADDREILAALALDLARRGRTVTAASDKEDEFGPWWTRATGSDVVQLEVRDEREHAPAGSRGPGGLRPGAPAATTD